jgi:hypothetical protein
MAVSRDAMACGRATKESSLGAMAGQMIAKIAIFMVI